MLNYTSRRYKYGVMQLELIHVLQPVIRFSLNRTVENIPYCREEFIETLYLIIRKIRCRSLITIHDHAGPQFMSQPVPDHFPG